ncbi:MAG: hypothetical protein IKM05_00300 [Clostridia bacterium]|nr:hypothetical protein [Clostridia bacterium]
MKRFFSAFILLSLCFSSAWAVSTAAAAKADESVNMPVCWTEKWKAAQFLQDAGIAVYDMKDTGNELHFSLPGGGTGVYYSYGEFRPYDMNFRFEDITEEEMALFLDHYLSQLVRVEQGNAPEEYLRPDYDGSTGKRNMEVIISNALGSMENLGDPWLQVLLHQLSLHDDNDALNSMRARLASRMLGKRDITPVDPKEGCAWYDALTLSVQDDLPPVDAATYVDDPLIASLTQEMITYTDNRKASWHGRRDVDNEKTVNIVFLSIHKMKETENTLTLWAMVSESQYALYDGNRYQSTSGSRIPTRLTYIKASDGSWCLQEVTESGDGTEYYPSILAFCNNDAVLAKTLANDFSADTDQCFFRYLEHNGYPIPAEIPY